MPKLGGYMLEKIKNALGEELSKQVEEILSKADIELAVMNDGSVVKADKHDTLKKELKDTLDQFEKANVKISELSKGAETSETLKKELEKVNSDFELYKADTKKREVNSDKLSKFKDGLSKYVSPDAIALLLKTTNPDDLMLNEAGEIVDLESKANKIIESYPSLKLNTEFKPNVPGDKKTPDPVDTSAMTDAEYYAYIKTQ